MASLTYIMSMARDALLAQTAATAVTGDNISNASTPGFVRRSARLETTAIPGAAHGVAGGVRFAGVDRAFERFTFRNVVRESGNQGAAAARHEALSRLEGALSPAGSPTLGDRLDALLGSFEQLAAKADDASSRRAVASSAEDLAKAFRDAASTLDRTRGDLLRQAQGVAADVNGKLDGIARINAALTASAPDDAGRAALLDQRDELVRQVGTAVDVNALYDDRGRVTLLSSGSTLVEGDRAADIDVSEDASRDLHIEFRQSGHATDVSGRVDAGTLGGLVRARDDDIPAQQTVLDALAFDFASAVNTLHASGYGLDGSTGRALFTAADGSPLAAALGAAYGIHLHPEIAADHATIAAAKSLGDIPGGAGIAVDIAALAHEPVSPAGTPAEGYAALAGMLGNQVAQAGTDVELREGTLAQAEKQRQSTSGVSLEEEMVNLSRYQRAFEASMRVLKTADEMLAGLIQGL